MPRDRIGLEMTAANDDAVGHYDDVVFDYLGFGTETGAHLKAALAADPELAMGHCLKGYFFLLFAQPALIERARKSLAAAEASIEARGATERERTHVAALGAWCAGDLVGATAAWERILLGHPRDALAIRLAHYTHFYLGDSVQLRDSVARVLHAWSPDVPGYGFVLGAQAFGLEEAGDYATAEEVGRRAVEINPADIWAVHAVAHVMEMQGRHREGIDWIRGLEDAWKACNNFRYHVWWHRALFHLELGEHDAVLDLYDREIRAERSEDYLDISNAVALLWRLEDAGVAVGDRWQELADKAEARIGGHVLAFADAHYLMALAAAGRGEAADRMIASTRAFAAADQGTEAPILAEVALPLEQAIVAYCAGDHAAALDLLLPIRYDVRRIGGSHAQRDVFAQLLIQAAARAGRLELARALLSERTMAQPRRPSAWALYGRVLDELGDQAAAENARAQAAKALAA